MDRILPYRLGHHVTIEMLTARTASFPWKMLTCIQSAGGSSYRALRCGHMLTETILSVLACFLQVAADNMHACRWLGGRASGGLESSMFGGLT